MIMPLINEKELRAILAYPDEQAGLINNLAKDLYVARQELYDSLELFDDSRHCTKYADEIRFKYGWFKP